MPKKFLRTLQLGFGISIVILFASSVASYLSIREQLANRGKVERTQETIAAINGVLIDLQNAETSQRGFFLTRNDAFLAPFNNSAKSLSGALTTVGELVRDQPLQSRRVDTLSKLVTKKMAEGQRLVQKRKDGLPITEAELESSRLSMDTCRNLIARFVETEESRLDEGTEILHRSSNNTVTFIVLAAILSLGITVFFYRRIREDFNVRESLQLSLKKKDAEISKRLRILQRITYDIAHGDYSVRVEDREKDELGSLAVSINEMTDALQSAFEKLNNNEWKQSGLASLNEALVGNKTEEVLASDVLDHLVFYGGCANGALYLIEEGRLVLKSSHGLERNMPLVVEVGEGVVGQVFKDGKERLFEDLPGQDYVVSFTNGQLKVGHVLLLPLMIGGSCIGVVELGSIKKFDETTLGFYRDAARGIGLALSAAKGRQQVQKLLEETQAQSEELQMQHAELENLNAELEAQAQKLQASEEELKVQQEELLQSNQELEERSKLLEEKNLLIAERNLEIRRKAEELALSTKYKSEFLANMSHELRTPLNSILLLSRLMAENPDKNLTDEQVESAKVIQSSGTSLLSLIDEILDLSKIEAGKMELDYQMVDIGGVTEDLRAMFLPIVQEKSLALEIEVDPALDATLETDRTRLEQVLRNFLSNAVKFTAKGKITLSVSQDEKDKGYVVFAVKDSGIGIPKDKQKVIFEAFQQADGSTRRKYGGTGLGLSISREIARLLGGEIRLHSEEHAGSTFSLVIPKTKKAILSKPSTEQLVEEITQKAVETTLAVAEPVQGEHSGGKYIAPAVPEEIEDDRHHIFEGDKVILIIEDDTAFAKALLGYTRKRRYKGVVAVRGDVAVAFAERYKPLAILLDIQLPVKSGWEVMDELKSNASTKHIPVHIMSSLEVKKESLLKGAVDFIDKPIALDRMGDMFEKIENALSRHPKKVLIVEENLKHAKALAYFLGNFNIVAEIKDNVRDSVDALRSEEADCVILDMGVPDRIGYDTLEAIKNNPGLEKLPIIVFTGRNLSLMEESKIKKYADSIVVKTAHSYQRILDEVGLFLHLVEEKSGPSDKGSKGTGMLEEVLKGQKVLIADDDVRNIFSLSKALEQYQMTVITAVDGKDALRQLEDNPGVSVILMDMMMPEMDGYETIKLIRQQPRFKKLPIMAVTAKAMTGDREKCILAGASDYISKPVDIDQLLSLLRVWLYNN